MRVALAQAAVQLILLVLVARVPGGEWSQSGGWGWGRGPTTLRTHSPSSSPVSLSKSRKVESRLDTRVHWPSRLKQMQVMGPGGRGGQAFQAGVPWAVSTFPARPPAPATLTAHVV